jgi:hypothetical protein
LADAWRVVQLASDGATAGGELRDRLLDAALVGLAGHERAAELSMPASYRLGFRELGLAIGLTAVPLMRAASGHSLRLERLAQLLPLRGEIEAFWLHPDHRRTATWLEHQNINEVMLATSLVPEGYLTLRS